MKKKIVGASLMSFLSPNLDIVHYWKTLEEVQKQFKMIILMSRTKWYDVTANSGKLRIKVEENFHLICQRTSLTNQRRLTTLYLTKSEEKKLNSLKVMGENLS